MKMLKEACAKALLPFSLATLLFCSSSAKKFNASEPNVLELNYEKDFEGDYSLSAKAKVNVKGFLKGHADAYISIKGKSKVIEEDEESSMLEAKVQKVYAEIDSDLSGVKYDIKVDWDADKSKEEMPKDFFKNAVFYLSVDNGGEIYFCDEEQSHYEQFIDLFPDEAVRIGDSWGSECNGNIDLFSGTSMQGQSFRYLKDVTLKLSGKTKHKGRDILIIEFYGKGIPDRIDDSDDSDDDKNVENKEGRKEKELEEVKGRVLYDPLSKKILEMNAALSINRLENDGYEKTSYTATAEYSLKEK